MKKASSFLLILAVVLSNVMSATVAYGYCNMQWGIRYNGFSAPTSVAFLSAIPYAILIAACLIAAYILRKKATKT